MSTLRRLTTWTDAAGQTRQTVINVATGDGSDIESQVSALSNAFPSLYVAGILHVVTGTPRAATFLSARDYAELLYDTASGAVLHLAVPAPRQALFLSDNMTVDPAQLTALDAAVLGNLQAPDGSTAASYRGGFRKKKE